MEAQHMTLVHITNVIDGDTLITSNNERIRLNDVDAPEMHTGIPGDLAKLRLHRMTINRLAMADVHAVDVFGRYVCDLWIDGENVNEKMRRLGYH
jgi:endonuclease YncB( thermonuclease family)